jgi:hypothetical protein
VSKVFCFFFSKKKTFLTYGPHSSLKLSRRTRC